MKKDLADLGFLKDGRYWRSPETDIMIEFPSDELAGTADKVQPVEYAGRQAYFIGIEDIILNRVQEAKHWNYLDSAEWARTYLVECITIKEPMVNRGEMDLGVLKQKNNSIGILRILEKNVSIEKGAQTKICLNTLLLI